MAKTKNKLGIWFVWFGLVWFFKFGDEMIYRVACVDVGVVLQMFENLVQMAVACRA